MSKLLELNAKISEHDDEKRAELFEVLSYYPVKVIETNGLIEVSYEGNQKDMDLCVEIMHICELCPCHMFRLRTR